jgi:uncharacterized protein (TIGR02444 family)
MTNLWQFSCEFYQQEGIQSACLELQDQHQMQVNVLLLMRYLGGLNYKIDANQLVELLENTQLIEDKVKSIRAVRRTFNLSNAGAAWGGVYQKLKQAELEAEKYHIQALEKWTSSLALKANSTDTIFKKVDESQYVKHNMLVYWAVNTQLALESVNEEQLPAALLLLTR